MKLSFKREGFESRGITSLMYMSLVQSVKSLTRTHRSSTGRNPANTWLFPEPPACQAPLTMWDLAVSVILYTNKQTHGLALLLWGMLA